MFRRVKPANAALAISILALIAAVVVPAVAEVATTSLSKKEKRLIRKIARLQANRQITRRAPRLSVKQAQAALNADAASSAVNSQNATNADKVDGLDVGCPSATVLVAGLCFEATRRAAATSYQAARSDCADEGRYLATADQLTALGLVQGGSGGPAYEYTSNLFIEGGKYVVIGIYVTANGEIVTVGFETPEDHPYRCVTGPVG